MNLAIALDSHFCQHSAVMLTSLRKNTTYGGVINLYVITADDIDNRFLRLKRYCESLNFAVFVLKVSDEYLKSFPVNLHVTIAAYYRLFIAGLLPHDLEKVIYLDSDMVVLSDLVYLWNLDIGSSSVAAVRDQLLFNSRRNEFNITTNYYFNSGLLICNLRKWREQNLEQKLISFIVNNNDKILWWDQDALNAVLGNEYLLLDDKWNIQTSYIDMNQGADIANFKIIHYTSEKKPWLPLSNHPLKEYYFKYLKYTPWWHYPHVLAFNIKLEKLRHRIRMLLKPQRII